MRSFAWMTLVAWAFCSVSGVLGMAKDSEASSLQYSDHICRQWYSQKKYLEASRCFLDLFGRLKSKKKREDEEREKMGAALRNVGIALIKAADLEKSRSISAYLREQAVQYLDQFLKRKLYISQAQRRYTATQRDSQKEKIGYATLTILLPNKRGELSISGYKAKFRATGSWGQPVRPGSFVIVARYEGQTQVQEVVVEPGQPKVVRFAAVAKTSVARPVPTPVKKVRIVPWILVGLGAALAVTGGVVVGAAFATKSNRDTQLAGLKVAAQTSPSSLTLENTRTINDLHQQANVQLGVGIAMGGVGLAAAVVGGILLAIKPTPSAPPNAK